MDEGEQDWIRSGQHRFCLGTAALGMSYGITNTSGMPTVDDAHEVIKTAYELGIRCFDTAPAYGAAEERLGGALMDCPCAIVTKLNLSDEECSKGDAEIEAACYAKTMQSRRHLGDSLVVLLMHNIRFFRIAAAWRTAKRLREDGVVAQLGVSVYSPEEALEAIKEPDVTCLQIPFNLLDWRWRDPEIREAFEVCPTPTVRCTLRATSGGPAGTSGCNDSRPESPTARSPLRSRGLLAPGH